MYTRRLTADDINNAVSAETVNNAVTAETINALVDKSGDFDFNRRELLWSGGQYEVDLSSVLPSSGLVSVGWGGFGGTSGKVLIDLSGGFTGATKSGFVDIQQNGVIYAVKILATGVVRMYLINEANSLVVSSGLVYLTSVEVVG